MNRTYLGLLLFVFFLVLPPSVWAQHTGPYLGVSVGGQFLSVAKNEDSQGSFNLEYLPAPSASVILGWDLETGSPLGEGRVELEYTRRSNSLDQAEFTEGKVKGAGDLTADSLLTNSFTVFKNDSICTPYVGIGLGVARISAENLTVTGVPLVNDDTLIFAYQFGAGIDIELTRSLTLDLGYRFFSGTKAKFKKTNGDEIETQYLSHSAMLGLRYGF